MTNLLVVILAVLSAIIAVVLVKKTQKETSKENEGSAEFDSPNDNSTLRTEKTKNRLDGNALSHLENDYDNGENPINLAEKGTKHSDGDKLRNRIETGGLPYILVAEDNLSNFKLIEVMLRNVAVTDHAINGKVAVEKAKTIAYDMIFMDVKMPIMNGMEATREIRKFDEDIPIIAVTANVLDFDKNMAIASGCNDFVPKPIIRKKLFEVIDKYKK